MIAVCFTDIKRHRRCEKFGSLFMASVFVHTLQFCGCSDITIYGQQAIVGGWIPRDSLRSLP